MAVAAVAEKAESQMERCASGGDSLPGPFYTRPNGPCRPWRAASWSPAPRPALEVLHPERNDRPLAAGPAGPAGGRGGDALRLCARQFMFEVFVRAAWGCLTPHSMHVRGAYLDLCVE